jgi:hypothetical protein
LTEREREQLGDDLSAYLDGELAVERAQEVERLLSESAEARELLEELRRVSAQLGALPRLRVPDAVAVAVTSRAEEQLRLVRARQVRRVWIVRVTSGVAAAAAVLVAGVWIGYEAGRRSPMPVALRAAGRDVAALPATGEEKMKALEVAPAGAGETIVAHGIPKADVGGRDADRVAQRAHIAEEKQSNSLGAPADTGAPLVNIVVQPHDEAEYAAAAATLRSWGAPARVLAGTSPEAGGAGAAKLLTPEQPVAWGFAIAAAELPGRIGRLEAQAPQGVYVRVGSGAAEYEHSLPARGGAQSRMSYAQDELAAPTAAPRPGPARAKDEKAATAKRALAGASEKEAATEPVPAAPPPEKKSAAAPRRAPVAGAGVVATVLDANSLAVPGAPAETQPQGVASQPSEEVPASSAEWPRELTEQMLRLLFSGVGQSSGETAGPMPPAASFERGRRVTLRVLLLPVPASTAPGSQPNDGGRE